MDEDNEISSITPTDAVAAKEEPPPEDVVVAEEEIVGTQPWHPLIWAGLGLAVGLYWRN